MAIDEVSKFIQRVTLKQLRAFVSIARERSFTRAASRLGLSQSALTLQIRELETEIGLRLFDRSSRFVELTAAGEELYPAAERLLGGLHDALDGLRSVAQRARGSVTVLVGASVLALAVAPAIARLARDYPGISMRVLEHVGGEAAQSIAGGHADFGLVNFVRPSDLVESTLLLRDRIGILCHAQHPLAKSRSLDWSAIARYPFATALSQGLTLREVVDKHPAIGAILPRPRYEASSISALMAIVEQGACIALLPRLAGFTSMGRKLVFLPVRNPAVMRELFFVSPRRRSLTPAARQAALFIVDELERLKSRRGVGVDFSASGFSAFRKMIES